MTNLIQNIIHRATTKPNLNIFVLPYDGEYERGLSPHRIYTNPKLSIKEWANKSRDKNFVFFDVLPQRVSLPETTLLDCVIINNFTYTQEIGLKIASMYQIPIFVVVHEKANSKWQKQQIKNGLSPNMYIVMSSTELANWWNFSNQSTIEYPTENAQDFNSKWNSLLLEKVGKFDV